MTPPIPSAPDYRRVKRFALSDVALLQIFRAGKTLHIEIAAGFPADATAMRYFYDREIHAFFIVVQSATFEPVKEGAVIPFGYITIKNISEATQIRGGANVEGEEGGSCTAGSEGGLQPAGETGTTSEGQH